MAERVTRRSRSARNRAPHTPVRPATRSAAAADRYRPGNRRTDAEPLEASWRPEPPRARRALPPARGMQGKPVAHRSAQSRLSRMIGAYGWRIYALPVLLVITVIALVDARDAGPPSEPAASAADTPTADAPPTEVDDPRVTENPVPPVDLKIPTAELPPGGEFTQRGRGTWHLVKGAGKVVGSGGRLYKYTVEVEDGIDPASYGGDELFAKTVDHTLADPRSWTGDGKVRFQRVAKPSDADFRISLTTPFTDHKPDVCGFQIKYEASCYRRSLDRVVINLARWVRGAKAFSADMTAYRQYAINHEVGHALGNSHVGCARNGDLAPVMMQQSFGVANNYVAKLNRADPTNYGAVAKDGKVCKPNAWPNPSGE